MNGDSSPTALARRLVAEGHRQQAERVVADMIAQNFDLAVSRISINADWSSLNSLNGIVETETRGRFFFKFHQEEGEEATVEEYYRAELLQSAGLPVDVPVMICRRPGHQVLLYQFRRDRQLAAACLDVERGIAPNAADALVGLERDLDRLTGAVYVRTLHQSSPELSVAEPIHQLFHNRLVSAPDFETVGGRVARFYVGRSMALPGATLGFEDLARLRWRINGLDYRDTVAGLFADSVTCLAPGRLSSSGGVVAHGDAHNANVWIEEREAGARLVLFDPAFAGSHVPALLADIKATFHNVFAHPFWLYHPQEAEQRYQVVVRIRGDVVEIHHDWELSPLRRGFLNAKVVHVWRPLLKALQERKLLPDDWRRVVRLANFCCPTLVMTLCAGAAHGATAGRSPAISALSFAIAVMAGSEPVSGSDIFTEFLEEIAP